jgi:hypothetical protein
MVVAASAAACCSYCIDCPLINCESECSPFAYVCMHSVYARTVIHSSHNYGDQKPAPPRIMHLQYANVLWLFVCCIERNCCKTHVWPVNISTPRDLVGGRGGRWCMLDTCISSQKFNT